MSININRLFSSPPRSLADPRESGKSRLLNGPLRGGNFSSQVPSFLLSKMERLKAMV